MICTVTGKWHSSGFIGIGAIAIILMSVSPTQSATPNPIPQAAVSNEVSIPEFGQSFLELTTPQLPPLQHYSTYIPSAEANKIETLYGHLPYSEAPLRDLVNVGNGEQLRHAAAVKFREMVRAAAADGVQLVPLSGFRDRHAQEYVFYRIARQRGQSLEQRARSAAPPGHSEHHTGYAIDIGDRTSPAHNLRQSFENTAAFRWLSANAGAFGFEMSFPPNHPQVNYEPWHWRWVGNAESQQVFRSTRHSQTH